ncbi:MAG: S8 family peptidase [Bacteroidia bacterium]
MKKNIFFTLTYILIHFLTAAQSKINFSLAERITQKRNTSIDVFVKGNIKTIKEYVTSNNGIFKYAAGDIAVVNLSFLQIGKLINNRAIERIEAYPQHIQPLNDTMVINNNILPVYAAQYPLTQPYDGSGVVVGFIDSGIDFTHPDFKDSLGKSRIRFIWDQTLPKAQNSPQPYGYGQEWNNLQIDSGKATAHNDLAYWGHGTHTAGIAVGNGLALKKFKGVAPKADIIMVALDFKSTSPTIIADATHYIYSKALAMGKPCVINASIGDSYGSHDGLDLQAQLISNLINQRAGQVFVAAAGNDGNKKSHVGYAVTADTNFTLFSYSSNSIYIQLWADTANFKNVHFSIGADKMIPTHQYRARIPFSTINNQLGFIKEDTLKINGKRIGRVQSYADILGGTYSIEFNILPDSTTYAWRLLTTGSGKFDLWSFDGIASNLPPLSSMPDSTHYQLPNTAQTIASSFQCLDNVITVANYTNRNTYVAYKNNLVVDFTAPAGAIAATSSMGPTRDGRMKPDIAAPGHNTLAAVVLSTVPGLITNKPNSLAKGGYHVNGGGTSNAAPSVSGIAALYLQKNPTATAMQVKNAIISCTKKDAFTGYHLPNTIWGYGKIDAFNVLTDCAITGIKTYAENKNNLVIYPNPSTGNSTTTFNVTTFNTNEKTKIIIYNNLGQAIKTIVVNDASISLQTELPEGIYFCKLLINNRVWATKKLVIL